jgi:Holliday junction resolvase RusA-like endonuclease
MIWFKGRCSVIELVIKQKPLPQKRHRSTRNGHMYDPSSKDKKNFILQISNKPKKPITDPIVLGVRFIIPYAKKWYRTGKFAGILKDSVPVEHTQTPDIDNLLKFVMDAGNKILWQDDSQIWRVEMEKVFGREAMTEIDVYTSIGQTNKTIIKEYIK